MKLCKLIASTALLLALACLSLSGCGQRDSAPAASKAEATAAPSAASAPSTPAPTAMPTVPPTPTPTPVPTPEPTPDPARFLGIHNSEQIAITKQPGGEDLTAGGAALFIAHAEGAVSREWRFVAPERDREILWNAPELAEEVPGLVCTGGDTDTLSLSAVPGALDGWQAVCLFTDAAGGMTVSDGAELRVTESIATAAWAPAPAPIPAAQEAAPAPVPQEATAPVWVPEPQPPAPAAEPVYEETPAEHRHSFVDSVYAPACEDAGYTLHQCSCGESYTDGQVPALGHDWQAHTESRVVRQDVHTICAECGMDLTANGITGSAIAAHAEAHALAGGGTRRYETVVDVYEDVTTYVCSRCGRVQ